MHVIDFIAPLRSLAVSRSRRGLFAASSGGLLTALLLLGIDESAARNSRRRKNKRKHAPRKKRKKTRQAAPIVRIDASCSRVPGAEIPLGGSGNDRAAQTFTPLATGLLVRAEMPIFKDNDSSGDYILRISPVDAAGVPTNGILAEAIIANANVPDGESILSGAFATPATVEAGATYALVLSRPGDDQLELVGLRGNRCGGQTFRSPDQTTPFEPLGSDLGLDLPFTTFVLA